MPKQPRKKNGRYTFKAVSEAPKSTPDLPKKAENFSRVLNLHRIRLVAHMMDEGYSRKRAAEVVSIMSDDDVKNHLSRR